MNIIMVHCKLNRFYRRTTMDLGITFEHIHNLPLKTPENVLDDLDNMLAGCAFE